jgi:aerobic carbon-monoxide dehydrogenase large subunit
VTVGGGAHSGRGMRLGSIVIKKSTDGIIEKGLRIAEHLLETAAADIEFKDGRFTVKGTNHAVGLFDVARAALERPDLPEELRGPLYAACDETVAEASYPYGAHVCEVEVDPDTGAVKVITYVAVDDVGRAVNPLIIHGQVHGGIAQGVGQALMERATFDDHGQLLTASLLDYSLPRADNLPDFDFETRNVPSTTNPMGLKGAGEAGSIGSTPAVMNAIGDALWRAYRVEHIDMPATPLAVFQAIKGARAGR